MVDRARVIELARKARHVMIADEGLGNEGVEQGIVAVERPGELKEIAVVERAPDRLPQLVLRHGVDTACLDEGGIVAVDDLAEEIGVRMLRAHFRQHARPKSRRNGVGGVEPPAGRAAVEPMDHDLGDEFLHLGRVVVEDEELRMALEGRGLRPLCAFR